MTSRIPVRSRRQAMDWSLVLVSQGIETSIDQNPDEGWALIVPAQDSERAFKALRQYHLENPRWPWHQAFSPSAYPFDWTSLAWVFLIGLFFWFEKYLPALLNAGGMDALAVTRGEWWRLFTAVFLHADAAHLAANALIGCVLLGLTMGRYGTGIGILAAYFCGIGGNVATWLVYGDHRSIGASGMVMGCIGLLAVQSLSELFRHRTGAPASSPARTRNQHADPPNRTTLLEWKHSPAFKYVVSGLAAGAMLFAYLGLNPASDVLAHFGGFVSGILLGSILVWIPRLPQRTAVNISAGALFCLLTTLAWWRAVV